MADKNKKLPGHKWKVRGSKQVDGANFFVYACAKCPAVTLNGQPLQPPFDEFCGKEK